MSIPTESYAPKFSTFPTIGSAFTSTTQISDLVQEFDDNGNHRIVHKSDASLTTPWARYTGIAFCDGWVSYTGYYGGGEKLCSAAEFALAMANAWVVIQNEPDQNRCCVLRSDNYSYPDTAEVDESWLQQPTSEA